MPCVAEVVNRSLKAGCTDFSRNGLTIGGLTDLPILGDFAVMRNLNDYTASIHVNGKCKHKHLLPFYMFSWTGQASSVDQHIF